MIGFRFSLVVDLGLGAAASSASSRYRHASAATNAGGTANAGTGLSRHASRVPLEPLPTGPLGPEREAQRQLWDAMCRGEE